ncbi:MAG: oligosaccharide flippase family protein [Planctomycetia bacterium]|nr:oligosaccharide flippase family protein [Planctomycetia bacterium]
MAPATEIATPLIDGVPHASSALAELHLQAERVNAVVPALTQQESASGRRVVSGSLWTIAGYGTGQVIRLVGNILVSRLVLPEAFGIMALVNILTLGLAMFSDVGIEAAIVQHRRGDEPRFYNTAWSVQVVRGWFMFVVACLLAWPASILYEEPRLLTLLPAAAACSLINGLTSTAIFTSRRHLLLGRLTILELSSQIIGVATMCLYASQVYAGAWAMVAGLAASELTKLIGSHLLIPGYRNRPAWDRPAFDALFQFGRWVLVSTMITFCAMQVDRLLLGRLISKELLGVYSVALAIAMLPTMLLQALNGSVLYPLLARYARKSLEQLRERLSAAREILTSLGLFFIAGVVLEAETFFALMYDERYAAAGRIAQLLAPCVWTMMLSATLERVPQAIGETRVLALYNLAKVLVVAVAATVGFYWAGLEGFIAGYTVGIVAGHLVLMWQLEQHGISVWRDDLRMTASALLTIWVGLTFVQSARSMHPDLWVGLVCRETAAWTYLAVVGIWALSKTTRLKKLSE